MSSRPHDPHGPGRHPNGSPQGSPPSSVPADARKRWFADASDAQRQAAVHALLAVATGDGLLNPEEKTAIAEACERLGVRSMDVAKALSTKMPAMVEPPADSRARLQLMMDCAAVMVADRRIDDRELAVLLMVGRSLGFGSEQVASIASRVADAVVTQLRRQSMIEKLLDEMT